MRANSLLFIHYSIADGDALDVQEMLRTTQYEWCGGFSLPEIYKKSKQGRNGGREPYCVETMDPERHRTCLSVLRHTQDCESGIEWPVRKR